MKLILKKIYYFIFYIKDYFVFIKQYKKQTDFNKLTFLPILMDKEDSAGTMSGAYFHQDLLVAQKIYENKPQKHVDIGSRIDGFVAHVATFRKLEIFDIRPIESNLENITFKQADLMNLDEKYINYCDSISSLSVIEHFGLGRYGDPIDINGHLKGLENIYKILKKGGIFYFSVPIGPQRIEFNAHRAFSLEYLFNLLNLNYTIKTFSYINDNGELFLDIEFKKELLNNNFGCNFGHGVFELIKK